MPSDRIEIYPGCTIDVSRRYRHRARLDPSAKIIALSEAERKAALSEVVRSGKYTTLLLDEAVRLSIEVGERKAGEITGVNQWSIRARKRILTREGKYVAFHHNPEQIKQCAELAEKLIGKEVIVQVKRKMRRLPAFIEAGKRLGMNGHNVYKLYQNGLHGIGVLKKTPLPPRNWKRRYTVAQKQACVALAMELVADPARRERPHTVPALRKRGINISHPKWNIPTAFIEAGRRLGMNGRSIMFMWKEQMIPPPSTPPRQ